MNILFLTLGISDNVSGRGIYSDLVREIVRRGHELYIASPVERRYGEKTHLIYVKGTHILRVKTLNIQKTNSVEKGLAMLLLERQFKRAIKRTWGNVQFDMVLYSTPPITFNGLIEWVKGRCQACSYLMLKDIFPQNAVDLQMMSKKWPVYYFFRKKEKRLYAISDTIGCTSPANIDYVLRENPGIPPGKLEICPNSIEPLQSVAVEKSDKNRLLESLNIPTDKTLSIYGGNLGKPQGIDFLMGVLETHENIDNSFIVIVGSGTEYGRLKLWFDNKRPRNAMLLSYLPKAEYDKLVACADIGLIFLDYRFTIPNYPSRLLSYMECSIPVIVASDPHTDIGSIAEQNGYGLWSTSNDVGLFMENLQKLVSDAVLRKEMGKKGREFLLDNYTASIAADIVLSKLK